jgi:filamentous hemagglutinin family protein
MIMKKVRQITKKYYVRQIMACWMVLSMLVVMPVRIALAEVVMTTPPGDITVTPLNGGTHQDMTAADGAIGIFSDFDIALGHDVVCVQPDAGSEAMFKINGNGTEIFGTFEANGGIWLIDPAGILVGDTGVIDVGSLVASTLAHSDADFLSGNHNFTAGAVAGDVVNEGTIIADYGAVLIGKNVINTGSVSADNLVVMAAGDSVLLTDNGTDIVVKVDMPEADISDYTVDHGGDFGDGGIDAQRVVLAAGDIWSSAYISASDSAASDAIATIIIDAEGDVEVTDEVKAVATGNGVDDAIATVTVKAEGDVKVLADEGDNSKIRAEAYNGNNNIAKVRIDTIDGDVEVIANNGGNAEITAFAGNGVSKEILELATSNTADVTIYTNDVEVISESGGNALIQAKTMHGATNTSDVLICADGYVVAESGSYPDKAPYFPGGSANIQAIANFGDFNDAYLGIKAEGEGVAAVAIDGGHSAMRAEAKYGHTNTADVAICTDGVVLVMGDKGDAEIEAEAAGGFDNTANTGVCAVKDIAVVALSEEIGEKVSSLDGSAKIRAEAGISSPVKQIPIPGSAFATANTTVVSHEGSVAVIDYRDYGDPRTAAIEAVAHSAYFHTANLNTANVAVAAGKDLSPADLPEFDSDGIPDDIEDALELGVEYALDLIEENPGNVFVYGDGPGSMAEIWAYAYDGLENTADAVVCAPGAVIVESRGEGGIARIKSWAEGGFDNKATTQVYANEVYADSLRGGMGLIGALANSSGIYVHSGFSWIAGEDDPLYMEDDNGDSTLIIDSHANKKDCPDCLPCPECDDEPDIIVPVPALAQFQLPTIEGCPVEMQAVAVELGIEQAIVQVSIGNALALNPTLQPCQACATLINTAGILRDDDGSRMAAMNQMFNELAPADAPFTPEMATSVAMAFEGAAEGSQYASAMEFVDAFVRYVTILETQLGQPVEDSVAFVMDKYGAGVTDSDNANIAAYVAMRLEAVGG